jgi:hypothetical protein
VSKDNSIKTFGYGYLIGDAALMTAGILKAQDEAAATGKELHQTQKFKEAVAGGIYATAGLVAARYGNPSTEKKLELLYRDMYADLTRMGITVPSKATPELLARNDGLIAQMDRFLYRHPTQVVHAIFAAGGIPNMIAGMPKDGQSFNPSVFVSGLLITIGGLVGLLLPQKKPDIFNEPQSFTGKVLETAQKNPLATAATIFTTNNLFLLTGAMQDKKEYAQSTSGAQHAWIYKLATAAAYITSNYFLSRSTRDNTGGKGPEQEEILKRLQETSARLVQAQPAAMQEAVLERVAGYLASKPDVHATAEELATQIRGNIEQLAGKKINGPSRG